MTIRVIEYSNPAVSAKSACLLLLAQIRKGHDAIESVIPKLLPAELGWQPLPGSNTIGMLLGHIAAVEGYWVAIASRRFQSDEEIELFLRREIGLGVSDDGMPPGPDGFPPAILKDKGADYFWGLIRAAERVLTVESREWTDVELGQPFEWGGNTLNLAWILHHLVAHLNYHHGQINQIRRYYQLISAARAQQGPESSSIDPGY